MTYNIKIQTSIFLCFNRKGNYNLLTIVSKKRTFITSKNNINRNSHVITKPKLGEQNTKIRNSKQNFLRVQIYILTVKHRHNREHKIHIQHQLRWHRNPTNFQIINKSYHSFVGFGRPSRCDLCKLTSAAQLEHRNSEPAIL